MKSRCPASFMLTGGHWVGNLHSCLLFWNTLLLPLFCCCVPRHEQEIVKMNQNSGQRKFMFTEYLEIRLEMVVLKGSQIKKGHFRYPFLISLSLCSLLAWEHSQQTFVVVPHSLLWGQCPLSLNSQMPWLMAVFFFFSFSFLLP